MTGFKVRDRQFARPKQRRASTGGQGRRDVDVMSQRVPVDDERLKNHRCGIDNCPSRKYYKVDGRIVCDRGHEQVTTLNMVSDCKSFLETADDDEGAEAVRRIKHRLGDTVEDQEEKAKRLDATRRTSLLCS